MASTPQPSKTESPVKALPAVPTGNAPKAAGPASPLSVGTAVEASYPLILEHSQEVGVESFGIIRSRLLRAQSKLGLRSLLITSAEKREGKTLITLNLGLSFGQWGQKRVLLVDGDLRQYTISKLLKVDNQPGLSDFLRGRKSYESVICSTHLPSLCVASAGRTLEEPLPAMLEGPKWPEFIRLAKQDFDLVIVDCLPATAPVADFELLLGPCDGLLLVVHMCKTTREGLARVLSRLDRKKLLGVLLNNADLIHDYDHYGYGKKYNR